MSWPSEVMLEDGGFNARYFRAIEDCVLWTVCVLVLSFYIEDLSELDLLESFKFYQVLSIQDPCLTSVKMKTAQNTISFGSVVVEYSFAEFSDGPNVRVGRIRAS